MQFENFRYLLLLVNRKPYLVIFNLFLILLFEGLLELIGVGLFFPLVNSILNIDALIEINFFKNLFLFFNLNEKSDIIKYIIIFCFLFYILKFILVIIITIYKYSFSYNLFKDLRNKYLQNCLRTNYRYHIDNEPGYSVNNIIREIDYINNYFFLPIVIMLSEVTILTLIVSFLFFFNTALSLLLFFLFGFIFLLYFFFIGNKTKKIGNIRAENDKVIIKWVNQALYGYKELVLGNKINKFLNKFSSYSSNALKASRNFQILSQLPRFIMEFVIIFILISIIFYQVSFSQNPSQILVTLGVFAGAAFKLLPSVNRIIYSYQAIQYSAKSCNIIIKEFKNFEKYSINKNSEKTIDKRINFKNEIQLKNINFSYNGSDNQILNNLDFNLKKGEVVGIIGKSGSGKSTLVNIILGLLKPNSGHYLIDNVPSKEYSFETKSQLFGYVPQDVYLINDSIKNNIAFGDFDNEFNKENLAEAIKLSSLDKYVSSLKDKENSIVGERGITLSGGQRQRVSIARALYDKPEILIFDEATSSLDVNTENSIINEISKLKNKKTILIITHRESILSICDKVYKLENKILRRKI